MQDQKENSDIDIDRHPLITIGILTLGTQIGSALIQKMAKHPAVLFTMGVTAGVYSYKNRKAILNEAQHLGNQGREIFSKNSDAE
jgi:hypothetical protein